MTLIPPIEELLSRSCCKNCPGKGTEHCYPDCIAPLTQEEHNDDNGVILNEL